MMRLDPVPCYRVADVWPGIQHWIDELNDRFEPWWRMPDPKRRCETRDAQLWLIKDDGVVLGAVITQITTDAARVAEVVAVVGDGMDDWLHLLNDLEHWARREGCVAMICTAAREGWVRALKGYGWTKQAVLVERRL